jgi:iron complex outermembrane recepter protein
MSYYYSIYDDFIGYQIGVKATFDRGTGFVQSANVFRHASNSSNTVTTSGFSIGVSHYFMKYYVLNANYSFNQLNTQIDDPIIPAFNTPTNKYNIGLSGRDIALKLGATSKIENIGFNFNYKWVEGFIFQGSPQFTGDIPTYGLLDGQINYRVPKINMTFKVGSSNILNNLHYEVYGGPQIGRLAYIGFTYEFAKKQ